MSELLCIIIDNNVYWWYYYHYLYLCNYSLLKNGCAILLCFIKCWYYYCYLLMIVWALSFIMKDDQNIKSVIKSIRYNQVHRRTYQGRSIASSSNQSWLSSCNFEFFDLDYYVRKILKWANYSMIKSFHYDFIISSPWLSPWRINLRLSRTYVDQSTHVDDFGSVNRQRK